MASTDDERIVAILRKAGGTMRRGELEEAAKVPTVRFDAVLARLRERGQVTSERGRNPLVTLNEDYEAPEVAKDDEQAFLDTLGKLEGRTTNNRLVEALGWRKEQYYNVRNALLDAGRIRKARGRGGVIETTDASQAPPEVETAEEEQERETKRESDLYEPVLKVLLQDWAPSVKLDPGHIYAEITAHQGRRKTGGTWTRPDITLVSFHRFKHLPDPVFDVITVEIKPAGKMDITAIYEAAAHGRFASRSLAFFQVPAEFDADESDVFQECQREAERHGVGLITATDVGDFDTWEVHLDGRRRAPDPISMDEFLSQQLSDKGKETLAGWYSRYWRERVKQAL